MSCLSSLRPERRRPLPRVARAGLALAACWLLACAPEVGDDCQTSLDCSTNNTRFCDRTQPGGYCTIMGCERNTCPEEAVCVKFNPLVERLATTYCMYECDDDGDCRESEGYRCVSGDDFGSDITLEALVLDGSDRKFCSIPASIPATVPMDLTDGGLPGDGGLDAGPDAATDAGPDAGPDAGMDAGMDASSGADAGQDDAGG